MADVNREDIFENMKQDVLNSKLDEVNKNKKSDRIKKLTPNLKPLGKKH